MVAVTVGVGRFTEGAFSTQHQPVLDDKHSSPTEERYCISFVTNFKMVRRLITAVGRRALLSD